MKKRPTTNPNPDVVICCNDDGCFISGDSSNHSELRKLAVALLEKGGKMHDSSGPEENDVLFEEVICLEEELLARFDLPHSMDNIDLLRTFYGTAIAEPHAQQLLDFLAHKAVAAQMEITDSGKILEIAKEDRLNPFLVLRV